MFKMPAGGGTGANTLNGSPEVIDLKVCMSLLKKTIVFFPLIIMVVIFLIRAYLTTDVKSQQLMAATAANNQHINVTRLNATAFETSYDDVNVNDGDADVDGEIVSDAESGENVDVKVVQSDVDDVDDVHQVVDVVERHVRDDVKMTSSLLLKALVEQ